MRSRARRNRGMTLVELMIVVIIIGILAAIAVVGYSKYRKNARVSEATAILAEFAAKEQLYFLEAGQYMEAHYGASHFPSQNENANEFWPHSPNVDWDSGSEPFSIYDSNGKLPDSWRKLGIRVRWKQLFCTYLANAGCPKGSDPGGSCDTLPSTVGQTLWSATPNIHWFYVLGVCNLMGKAGWPSNGAVTVLMITHDSTGLRRVDETQ
jgi:prepilin-type N-terminal cleavage/methylation domain-containing protein